jgi:hypothetical protein
MARPHDRQIRLADDVQNAPASRPQPASRIVVERRPAARLNRATAGSPSDPEEFDRSGVGTGYDGNSRAEAHVAEHTEDCWDVGSGAGAGGLPVAGLPAVASTPIGIAHVAGFSLDIPPSLLLLTTAGPLTKPPIGGPQRRQDMMDSFELVDGPDGTRPHIVVLGAGFAGLTQRTRCGGSTRISRC